MSQLEIEPGIFESDRNSDNHWKSHRTTTWLIGRRSRIDQRLVIRLTALTSRLIHLYIPLPAHGQTGLPSASLSTHPHY